MKKNGPARGQYSRPVEERFAEKVDASGGPTACWPWRGRPDTWGYGRFGESVTGGIGGWTYSLAHRVAWRLANGPIPAGLLVRHTCDNPPCVNPAHLELGSHLDNARDRDGRGRLRPRSGEANGNARLREEDVKAIRRLATTTTRVELAQRFGVRPVTIYSILARRIWRNVA